MRGYVLVEVRPYPWPLDKRGENRLWELQLATAEIIHEYAMDLAARGFLVQDAEEGTRIKVVWGDTGLEVWVSDELAGALGYRARCEEAA